MGMSGGKFAHWLPFILEKERNGDGQVGMVKGWKRLLSGLGFLISMKTLN